MKSFLCSVAVIIVLALLLFALNYFGIVGQRIIFENSFQYQQARDLEITTYEAQLAEIDVQLRRTDLTEGTRSNLEAQASGLRILIDAAKGRQK